ncbi:MAG: N-acetylmuramoyl-L-alanine amidase, partial [Bacteroidota bacterium]
DPSSNDLLLIIHTPTDSLIFARKQKELKRSLEDQRKRWKLDVIVIDAGHGGRDSGTIGVRKTKEKDITLGIALKLGSLIERNLKGVEVVYTRQKDKFVELYRRGQIANEAGGKLFISIHCNAMPKKPHPLKGFEIYLLRPGRTQEAIAIAERENAVVRLEEGYQRRYQELTEERFILLTMAQSAYARYSEQFAGLLQQEMEKRLELQNRGVKQAGFYVLVGASMPNVLVETGYLSNWSEEKFLKSRAGQQKVARGIFQAVRKYKEEYDKFLGAGKRGTSS